MEKSEQVGSARDPYDEILNIELQATKFQFSSHLPVQVTGTGVHVIIMNQL